MFEAISAISLVTYVHLNLDIEARFSVGSEFDLIVESLTSKKYLTTYRKTTSLVNITSGRVQGSIGHKVNSVDHESA
jgi:hypothetical protein